MKRIAYIILSAVFFVFILNELSFAATDGALVKYEEGLKLAKEKEYDFAFLSFRSLVQEYPKSKYAQDALFAVGEYFYQVKSYYDVNKIFNEYINKYASSPGAIFAKAYLYKIIEYSDKVEERRKETADKLTLDFFSQIPFLLMPENKERSYLSAFNNKFTLNYQPDKIEIYQNGKIFIEITR